MHYLVMPIVLWVASAALMMWTGDGLNWGLVIIIMAICFFLSRGMLRMTAITGVLGLQGVAILCAKVCLPVIADNAHPPLFTTLVDAQWPMFLVTSITSVLMLLLIVGAVCGFIGSLMLSVAATDPD